MLTLVPMSFTPYVEAKQPVGNLSVTLHLSKIMVVPENRSPYEFLSWL